MATTKDVENDIREVINFIQIKTLEEVEGGEGKKIEEDTAEELKEMLRSLAKEIGKLKTK